MEVVSAIKLMKFFLIFIVRVYGGWVNNQTKIFDNFHRQAAKHAMPRPHSHAPTMLSPWWVLEQMPPQVIVGDADDHRHRPTPIIMMIIEYCDYGYFWLKVQLQI